MLTFNLSVLDESPTGPLITNLPLVLINRFMINLRTTDSEMADVSLASIADQQQPQPTLQFRRPTDRLGNIGESLHHSWDDHWDGEDETGVEAYRFDDAVSSHDSKIECEVGCEVHSHASEMFVEGSSARV
ncbi:hypothetical protein PsYK624_013660 [Phanerochaete sordida]|uniref:Uncharacterized protein n=1 Tax=Phanerochaete sordida TaxID=48140 RepID=A0A9P3L925_9APHY|nr:hypothetical protein PsYK624_013660 [Phanerochaete sordida]